ncbi:MAG: MT-A70 family methyltransferase, partial [Thermaurantiacus sp.]
AKFYPTLPDAAVAALPIADLLAPRGVLFLWATSPRLDAALACLESWGLHYRGVAFLWVKTRGDGQPIGAQGIRPSIVKPVAEFVIAASRIRRGRPMPLGDESVAQVVMAPRREHSRKPDEVAARIERLYPDARRLELFSRTTRPGWEVWGDETGRFSET